MKKSSILVILVLALTTIVGCKPTIPEGIIDPDDMEAILYDYHIAQAMARETSVGEKDRNYNEVLYQEALLKKHGVTAAELDSSMIYYFSHADKFAQIYQNVSKRLNKNSIEIGAAVGALGNISTFSLNGDTANIWNDATELMLMPVPGYNRVSFEIKADTAYKKGDSFQFNMMSSFMYNTGLKDALVYMAITYDNDSIVTHTTHNTVSGVVTLRIPAENNHAVKQIRTFLYLAPSGDDKSNNMLFVSKMQLLRFHKTKDKKGNKEEADKAKEGDTPQGRGSSGDTLLTVPVQKNNNSNAQPESIELK